MSEPLESIGDPWVDAYLRFRRAWLDGASESELADLATECRRGLPNPTPPIPAAMFIHSDILITSQQNALPRQLVTALWVPDGAWVSGRARPAARPGLFRSGAETCDVPPLRAPWP